jgi:hypothetical protein
MATGTVRAEGGEQVEHDRYSSLRGKVLAHVGNHHLARAVLPHCDGLVLRGSAGCRAVADLPPGSMILIDRERYVSDRGRKSAWPEEMFSETIRESVASQLALGVQCLIAPSRFPTDRSNASIRRLLDAGREFVDTAAGIAPGLPVLVPIVVRYDELADGRWVEPVQESRLPIATVFASYHNALDTPERLEGAVELIRRAAIAVPLRCDLSVAGLMALGAVSGAIGMSSSVRHLRLPSKRYSAGEASRHVFVPAVANWMKASFVEQARAEPYLGDVFCCTCAACGPEGDVRALLAPGRPPDLLDRHSVAAAVTMVRSIVTANAPLTAWLEVCERAQAAYTVLQTSGISGPESPGAFAGWLKLYR